MIGMMSDLRAHPGDGELLRYLDRECDAVEREDIQRHVESCERCVATLNMFGEFSERLSAMLPALDVAPSPDASQRALARAREAAPEFRRGSSWQAHLARAAAIALILLGLGLTFSPVRAWLAERLSAVQTLIRGEPAAQERSGPAGQASPSTVSFVPGAGVFSIDIAEPQQDGALTLTVAEGPRASAQVLGSVAGEGILVLPNSLRIDNTSESLADYAVTLPGRLTEIRLRIGGEETLTVSTAGLELPASWSFKLSSER